MNVCAIIPAFNEGDVIAGLVTAARRHVAEVVVVDDGSADETGARAAGAGAVCLKMARNSGKGAAMRRGLNHVLDGPFSHVLFMDGDGQHRPEDIPALIDAARDGADLVIGVRSFQKDGMPASRYLSNTIGSRAASWLVGQRVRDSQCGFRLVRLESLRGVRLRARRYEFEMEVLIKLCSRGAAVVHAPVSTVYSGGLARSKMNPIRDTIRICLWSLAFRFGGL
jgi:glycosyltransferase involved in cell wall biosynthesis